MITMAIKCECGHTFEVGPNERSWLANPDRGCPSCDSPGPFLFAGWRSDAVAEAKPVEEKPPG